MIGFKTRHTVCLCFLVGMMTEGVIRLMYTTQNVAPKFRNCVVSINHRETSTASKLALKYTDAENTTVECVKK